MRRQIVSASPLFVSFDNPPLLRENRLWLLERSHSGRVRPSRKRVGDKPREFESRPLRQVICNFQFEIENCKNRCGRDDRSDFLSVPAWNARSVQCVTLLAGRSSAPGEPGSIRYSGIKTRKRSARKFAVRFLLASMVTVSGFSVPMAL